MQLMLGENMQSWNAHQRPCSALVGLLHCFPQRGNSHSFCMHVRCLLFGLPMHSNRPRVLGHHECRCRLRRALFLLVKQLSVCAQRAWPACPFIFAATYSSYIVFERAMTQGFVGCKPSCWGQTRTSTGKQHLATSATPRHNPCYRRVGRNRNRRGSMALLLANTPETGMVSLKQRHPSRSN